MWRMLSQQQIYLCGRAHKKRAGEACPLRSDQPTKYGLITSKISSVLSVE